MGGTQQLGQKELVVEKALSLQRRQLSRPNQVERKLVQFAQIVISVLVSQWLPRHVPLGAAFFSVLVDEGLWSICSKSMSHLY